MLKPLKLLLALALCNASLGFAAEPPTSAKTGTGLPEVTVYRSPTCGCCGKWMEQMKSAGFPIREVPTQDMDAIKRKLGMPEMLESCHTAVVDGYYIEGHVPVSDVKRLLETRPKGAGLAVPGMPVGSPGMEMGEKRDAYSVILFDKQGNADQFQQYPAR